MPETVEVGGTFTEGGWGQEEKAGPFAFVNQEPEPREPFIERIAEALFVGRYGHTQLSFGTQAEDAVRAATALADALGK